MLRIAFVVYRKWAYDIFKGIYDYQKFRDDFSIPVLVTIPQKEFRLSPRINRGVKTYEIDPKDEKRVHDILKKNKINVVCFYGWSSLVGNSLLKNFICLCLHPSLLPNYRGGSPIQNQLIRGEKNSGITIFRMDKGIDSGDIYGQANMSLLGRLEGIFRRMTDLGIVLTKNFIDDFLNQEIKFIKQKNLREDQVLKRRKPSDSELTLEAIKKMSFRRLNDIIRGLNDPYPNAYIKFPGRRLFITEIIKYKKVPKGGKKINSERDIDKNKIMLLGLKDGYARIIKHKKSRN